jgi:hypothetical protein
LLLPGFLFALERASESSSDFLSSFLQSLGIQAVLVRNRFQLLACLRRGLP